MKRKRWFNDPANWAMIIGFAMLVAAAMLPGQCTLHISSTPTTQPESRHD